MNPKQVLSVLSVLMNNADWDAVNAPILQNVIDNPRDAGRQFTAFLQNGGRLTAVATYWQTREGLYVHPSFTKHILPYAKGDATADISKVDFIDLPKNMSDSGIIATYLGGMEEAKRNAFTLNQVQALIDKQWTGCDGQLLTNGYANLFYVLGKDGVLFALNVFRDVGEWGVSDWTLGGYGRWGAGYRVFRKKN